jgi:hypothetical protein
MFLQQRIPFDKVPVTGLQIVPDVSALVIGTSGTI